MLTPLPFGWGVKNLGAVMELRQFSVKLQNLRHSCPSNKRRERMSLSFKNIYIFRNSGHKDGACDEMFPRPAKRVRVWELIFMALAYQSVQLLKKNPNKQLAKNLLDAIKSKLRTRGQVLEPLNKVSLCFLGFFF